MVIYSGNIMREIFISRGELYNKTGSVLEGNVEVRSYNHCSSGKARSSTYCVCVCVCSLRYPACNAHAPYCHLWPADSTIFFHINS